MFSADSIDIHDQERINTVLADPRNYVWRAVDTETLDGFVPDIGVTEYWRPNVFRPHALAGAGSRSCLRHRFHTTVRHRTSPSGPMFLAAVVHAAANEDVILEVSYAGSPVGRLAPHRRNNRRHLLVMNQPIDFVPGGLSLEIVPRGKGLCRIEHFALLPELPLAQPLLPGIDRLTTDIAQGTNSATILVNFITAIPSRIELTATARDKNSPPIELADPALRSLHTLAVEGVSRGTTYDLTIRAIETEGSIEQRQVAVTVSAPRSKTSAPTSHRVAVELCSPQLGEMTGYPLTFGLPLPQGVVPENPTGCLLRTNAADQPAQIRALANWPDGSIKWGLIDAAIPADFAAEVIFGPDASAAQAASLRYSMDDALIEIEGQQLRLRLSRRGEFDLRLSRRDGSKWADALQSAAGAFRTVLANGLQLQAGEIEEVSVEKGPRRAVVRASVSHCDATGMAHLRSTMRIQVYVDQPFVRISHRMEVISPALPPAASGGPLQLDPSHPLAGSIYGTEGEAAAILKLRSFELRLNWPGGASVRLDDHSSTAIQANGWRVMHEHDLAHVVRNGNASKTIHSRSTGHVQIDGPNGTLAIGVQSFWQRYPKAVSVVGDTVSVELFPQMSGQSLPGDEEAWHRLYFWLKDGTYLLKAGMALSNAVLLAIGPTSTNFTGALRWLESPVFARPSDIDYVNQTGALQRFTQKSRSVMIEYEGLANQAVQSFLDDQAEVRAYGQVNYGDWYGEAVWCWGNNEYDPPFCGYLEFLRGGDPRWAAFSADAARHTADVDTVNFSTNAEQVGMQAMHLPGHLGGYLPRLFRNKLPGTICNTAHLWVEGPLLHYLLTGEEFVRQSVERTAGFLMSDSLLNDYYYETARNPGWLLVHLGILARAAVGGHRRALNAAAIVVRRVLENREPGSAWIRMLRGMHCGCEYPRCRGEASFMVGVLLSGLGRIEELEPNPEIERAIIDASHWLIDKTFDTKSGLFRYTSCPNRDVAGAGKVEYTQVVVEGLAAAWKLSGDSKFARCLQRALPPIGAAMPNVGNLGLGKALSQRMRFVPMLMAILEAHPLDRVHAPEALK